MIASVRGLVIAAVLAAALIAAVIIDGLSEAAPVDRAIWPGFAAEQVTKLFWQTAGQPAVHAVRSGQDWQLWAVQGDGREGPPQVPADGDAIGEVLAALRGGRWHRLGDAGPISSTLIVVTSGERRVIGFGAPIEGTEQRWIAVDGRGMVVDRWVVRALDRDELSLRVRRPLAQLRPDEPITLPGRTMLTIEAQPWLHAGSPRAPLVAAALTAPLVQALRAVTIVRIPDSLAMRRDRSDRLQIWVAPVGSLTLGGECAGAPGAEQAQLRGLTSGWGDGCVERAQADAILQAVHVLQRPLAEIIERRPVPFEPVSIVLADGATLTLSPPKLGDAAADPARVAELLAALAAPAEPVALPPGPSAASSPLGELHVRSAAGGELVIQLLPDRLIRRSGESIALAPGEGAWAALSRPSRALREIATWREQPTAISAIQIDGIVYRRGATIGAWTRAMSNASSSPNKSVTSVIDNASSTAAPVAEPVDGKRAAALEALAAELAAPTVAGPIDGPVVGHHVVVTVAPPVGAQVIHTLKIGAPISAGCPAEIADETIILPAAACTQIAPLAR